MLCIFPLDKYHEFLLVLMLPDVDTPRRYSTQKTYKYEAKSKAGTSEFLYNIFTQIYLCILENMLKIYILEVSEFQKIFSPDFSVKE